MEFLIDFISSVLPYIKTAFLAIIPLGFLIFIHELGHFYAAKRCGIRVNTFSIGFGPKLVGFQRGETLYKISLLPFGGYVQMEGENPSEQTGAPGEFASASVRDRAIVVAAGPVVNLLFGVLVYWIVFTTGFNTAAARFIGGLTGLPLGEREAVQIGWVADDGPGAAGGIMPGDRLVSINGESIRNWSTFHTRVLMSPNKTLELVVDRDGVHQTLSVKPSVRQVATPNPRGDTGEIQVTNANEIVVYQVREESPAAQAGVQVGDLIESINGEKLYSVPDFGYRIWHSPANLASWSDEKYQAFYGRINEKPEALVLDIRRGDETLTLELPVRWRVIASIQEESIAEAAGIRNGDVLVALNGAAIDNATLYSELNALAGEPIEIDVMRAGSLETVVLPAEAQGSETDAEGVLFGLAWQTSLSGMRFKEKTAPLPEYNLFTGLGKGIEATWLTFTAVGRTLQLLIGGDVSPKQLAGPIGITHVTNNIFERLGLSSVIFFIGFISINLGIVNLLPIPIADGGQLLFCAVEKICGKPMPRKAQDIVQQVSVVLLIAFFLYVTWFDGMSLIHDLRN